MSTRVFLQCLVMAMALTAIVVEEAYGIPICNIDTNDLGQCRAAVTGNQPPPPTGECCGVIKRSDLSCLCKYKSYLPAVGIDPSKATTLLSKCGISNAPPACYA
ncbi:PREDICTED: putative lipid-transfer protein DIR1 [Tarenaya hassleriana]|uniref:putative lipid-transfer protein DIR1 n=1 Tax=Tarenaya hassleriana TaxID=28532 RepID=UPI00053C88EA|nr:PREDICTED: putative lipid-transfer protein DIR1 [Tarenaya hassleriana]